jgi:hypothetical protein
MRWPATGESRPPTARPPPPLVLVQQQRARRRFRDPFAPAPTLLSPPRSRHGWPCWPATGEWRPPTARPPPPLVLVQQQRARRRFRDPFAPAPTLLSPPRSRHGWPCWPATGEWRPPTARPPPRLVLLQQERARRRLRDRFGPAPALLSPPRS